MGGRSTLKGEIYGSVFDHHSVVYEFASGVRLYAFCRTIDNCYDENSSIVLGTKGTASVTRHAHRGREQLEYKGPKIYSSAATNPYQIEHDELFKAIRAGKPVNNGDYMARSTLIGIMGQLCCYTGKEVTWEQVTIRLLLRPAPRGCDAPTWSPRSSPGPTARTRSSSPA